MVINSFFLIYEMTAIYTFQNPSIGLYNFTKTFTYNNLDSVDDLAPTALDFGTQQPGQSNLNSINDPINITNLGNQNYTQVNVTAYNLIGATNGIMITASNFTASITDSSGTSLSNATTIQVPGAILSNGLNSKEQLYYWWTKSPNYVADTYSNPISFLWSVIVSV